MHLLSAILDHFDADDAVLLFEDGQKLRIKKTMVPGFVIGDTITLTLGTTEESSAEREKMLKGILNDIIDDKGE